MLNIYINGIDKTRDMLLSKLSSNNLKAMDPLQKSQSHNQ